MDHNDVEIPLEDDQYLKLKYFKDQIASTGVEYSLHKRKLTIAGTSQQVADATHVTASLFAEIQVECVPLSTEELEIIERRKKRIKRSFKAITLVFPKPGAQSRVTVIGRQDEVTLAKAKISEVVFNKSHKKHRTRSDDGYRDRHRTRLKGITEQNSIIEEKEHEIARLKQLLADSSQAREKELHIKTELMELKTAHEKLKSQVKQMDGEMKTLQQEKLHFQKQCDKLLYERNSLIGSQTAVISGDFVLPDTIITNFNDLKINERITILELLEENTEMDTKARRIFVNNLLTNCHETTKKYHNKFLKDVQQVLSTPRLSEGSLSFTTAFLQANWENAKIFPQNKIASKELAMVKQKLASFAMSGSDYESIFEFLQNCLSLCWTMTLSKPQFIFGNQTVNVFDSAFHDRHPESKLAGVDGKIGYYVWPGLICGDVVLKKALVVFE